jgi:putative SOS response-associated peptidase YedK
MINARAETAHEKPSFRAAFRRRRCLVPADGFFEWKRSASGRQPYYFTMQGGGPFGIAGLWERWDAPDGSVLETCALLTVEANELVETIHNRMPVIVHPDEYELWLTTEDELEDHSLLRHLMRPYPAPEMATRPVSTFVNNARNEGPDCIEG